MVLSLPGIVKGITPFRRFSSGVISPPAQRACIAELWKQENKKQDGRPEKNATPRGVAFPETNFNKRHPTRAEAVKTFDDQRACITELWRQANKKQAGRPKENSTPRGV